MTRIDLLNVLCEETRKATGELIMPVKLQEGDDAPQFRAAEVHQMRLPDSSAAKKKAPYIIHQVITGKDSQASGQRASSVAVVRSIFCVYDDDEEKGALTLLNLMERLRIHLLKQVSIGNRYQLDLEVGLETFIYPDDTSPYYAGEMSSTWKLPAIGKEVRHIWA